MSDEQTLVFGRHDHLVGTLTLPPPGAARDRGWAVLLTNAGVIPRVGPHRMNVRLARCLAERGVAAIRFDTSGLGDSRRPPSDLDSIEQDIADTRDAMDLVTSRLGPRRFAMVGFCSGGDLACQTALRDPRLEAALLFDSYVYPTAKAKLLGLAHRLRRHGPWDTAGRLLRFLRRRGAPPAAAHSESAAAAGAEPGAWGPVIFGRSRMPPEELFGSQVRQLVERGAALHFVYSGGEPDWYNHAGQFRAMFKRQGFVDRVDYTYLPRVDHTITLPQAQGAVTDTIVAWFDRRLLGSTPTAPAPAPAQPLARAPLAIVGRAAGRAEAGQASSSA